MLTLEDSAPEAAFRAEVRAWSAQLPEELRGSNRYQDLLAIDRLLGMAGLLGIAWPVEYGGRAAPSSHEAVLTDELAKVGVRRAIAPSHQGVNNLAPTLIAHGSPEQKRRHLPAILGVRQVWCQGFSEPDAGSDLANVRTTAERAGSDFVVRGSKIWTSNAQNADWIYLLVRTGSRQERHRSLSFLLVPMDSPGISLRPIRQITGGSEFCEVFFDDVVVADEGLVGDVGDGWRVALTLLSSERLSGRYRYAMFRRELVDFGQRLMQESPTTPSAATARDLGRAMAEVEGMGSLALRVDSVRASGADDGGLPSVNKLWWPQVHHRFLDFALQACFEARLDPGVMYQSWLEARPESIYGGSAQIQRNIISERILGMPRGAR